MLSHVLSLKEIKFSPDFSGLLSKQKFRFTELRTRPPTLQNGTQRAKKRCKSTFTTTNRHFNQAKHKFSIYQAFRASFQSIQSLLAPLCC